MYTYTSTYTYIYTYIYIYVGDHRPHRQVDAAEQRHPHADAAGFREGRNVYVYIYIYI